MSVPAEHLKLLVVPPRTHRHQITGIVWAVSCRRRIRNGTFNNDLFPIETVGTDNVSLPEPVVFALWPVDRGHCQSKLLDTHPSAQFLSSVLVDDSELIFLIVVVRHVSSPWRSDGFGFLEGSTTFRAAITGLHSGIPKPGPPRCVKFDRPGPPCQFHFSVYAPAGSRTRVPEWSGFNTGL